MDATYYNEMTECIERMAICSDLQNKYIFLFGHCEASEQMQNYLQKKGFQVKAILDNNENKHGKDLNGMDIMPPSEIMSYDQDKTLVLIASRAYESMKANLVNMGYKGRIVKVVDYNSFAEYSLSEDVYNRKYARVQRGISVLNDVKDKAQAEVLIACPYNALGDVYYAMAYLPYYLKVRNIRSYAVVVTGERCKAVAELFTDTNVLVLDRIFMDEMVQAVLYTEDKAVLIAHHDRPYTNDMTRFIDIGKLRLQDLYCCGVYGLKKGTTPFLPMRKEYAQKELLKKERSVIISPYAKSVVGIPESFWEKIIGQYMDRGFTVYTNVAGDERPLYGTKPMEIPIDEMISAVEYAGHFVGIRSGLCDVIQSAACEKTVVFSDAFYSVTNTKISDFFALNGWKQIVPL
ncbi:hypothetical protein [Lacrimispora sp.]|uniref:hypothetical protein n=1 Tax=Lacrimispora sp. TaxID=2719234 RepID=UPI0028AF97D0|nr:hypothetical protein [Lacrimispora sp.]